ncbi:MAG: alpha-E domain-containing protein [Planctomycetia bacterium]
MLCRVADSLFWMSRYLERAENQARFIDVTSSIALGYRGSEQVLWSSLLHAGGDVQHFLQRYAAPTRENVINYLLFDRRNLNSVASCLTGARENARSIRENLTTPMWEAVNRFYLRVRQAAAQPEQVLKQPHPFLDQIKRSAHQVLGVTEATWSRGEAWHFSSLGYQLERADKTSRILDVRYFILLPMSGGADAQLDVVQWAALLESTGALQMYRRAFGRIQPVNVVDFLILSPVFPRSLAFCIHQIQSSLAAISGNQSGEPENEAERLAAEVSEELERLTASEIIEGGLHQFVDRFQTRLNSIGQAVSETFFQIDVSTNA